MRIFALSLICFITTASVQAQCFMGMNGTLNNITQIKDNPVFTVHEEKYLFNYLGIGFEAGGNTLLFKKKAFGYLLDGNASMGNEYLRNKNSDKERMFWGNFEVLGPSAAFLVKKSLFFAVSTRMRYMVNADNLNSNVASLLGTNPIAEVGTGSLHTIDNFSIAAHAFSELGISYGGFFLESELHKIEGGVTLKILSGAGAAGMGIPTAFFNTRGNDGVAYNARGIANVAYTPYASEWAITANPFNPFRHPANNLGVGLSVGGAYYYNPRIGLKPQKGYMARIAVSITDIGSISYNAASTSGQYRISDSALNYRGFSNDSGRTFGNTIFNDFIVTGKSQTLSSSSKFKMGLPTALHVNGDVKIADRFFVNANFLINLRRPSPDKYSTHYVSSFTVAPRYRFYGRYLSVSLPFCFNFTMQGYMGAVVEAKHYYVGTTSLFQMLTSSTVNNLNIFFGSQTTIPLKKRQKEKDALML